MRHLHSKASPPIRNLESVESRLIAEVARFPVSFPKGHGGWLQSKVLQ